MICLKYYQSIEKGPMKEIGTLNGLIVPIICLLIFGSGCGNSAEKDPFANCKYGQPKPIFSAEVAGIQQHNFELDDLVGIESISFPDSTSLKIFQSGCDQVKQEFQYEFSKSLVVEEPDFWTKKAIELFFRLGQLGPEFAVYHSWAEAIFQTKDQFRVGEAQEVQPGFYVRIDKVIGSNNAILMLTLSENSNI